MKGGRAGEVERNGHIRQTCKCISCSQDPELRLRGVRGQQVSAQGNDVGVSADGNMGAARRSRRASH